MTALALAVSLVVGGTPLSIEDAWRRLPLKGSACTEQQLSYDYGVDGGMRNFYCRAATVLSYENFLHLAPVAPFLSGPHTAYGLNFESEQSFGHYDPAFVKWAVRALIPAAGNEALRKATQATYDTQVRGLARVWYRVARVLDADRAWTARARDAYLGKALKGGGGWSSPALEPFEVLLGDADHNWGGEDPNLVRSATAWWLRRDADETRALWLEGLEKLLTTYDAAWLKTQKAAKVRAPPALH